MSDKEHSHHHHSAALPDIEQRVKDLEALLIDKGLVDPQAMDELVDTYQHRVGPQNGARVVASAWTEWSERLSKNIASQEKQANVENSDDYYSLWQQTLEQFINERVKD